MLLFYVVHSGERLNPQGRGHSDTGDDTDDRTERRPLTATPAPPPPLTAPCPPLVCP